MRQIITSPQNLKVAIVTGLAVLAVKLLSTLFAYHLLGFNVYLAIVAVAFLLTGIFLLPRLTKEVVPLAGNTPAQITPALTNRELCIFEMLGRSLTNKEIAETLCIEVSTVKSHINALYQKIGCRNRIEAREKWKTYAVRD